MMIRQRLNPRIFSISVWEVAEERSPVIAVDFGRRRLIIGAMCGATIAPRPQCSGTIFFGKEYFDE